MIPRFRAWHKTWEEMGWIACIRYKKSGEIARLSFRRNIYDGNIYGGLVNIDEIELMQSTGLKDKNGKEIFEGDILAVKTDDGTLNVYVFWDEEHALFMFESKQYNEKEALAELLEDNSYPFEILGNIYENPELLEDKEVDN